MLPAEDFGQPMDIQDFQIFVRLAATRNLSAVGAEFGLTPGTISKRLQALENELRARLFDRTTRAIHITEEGEKFLKYADLVLMNVELAMQAVGDVAGSPRGRLKVSVSTGLGRRLIVQLLSEFMRAYPDIDIQVIVTDRIGSLLNEGIDVAIRNVVTPDSSEIARELCQDPQVLVAAPSYIAARGAPAKPEDLTAHDCLFIGDGCIWTFETKDGEHAVRVDGRVRSNSAAIIHELVLEGRGILRHAEMSLRDDIANGRLVRVLPEHPITTQSRLYAVYPRTRHMTPRLRAFVDFVVDWCRSPEGWQKLAGKQAAPPRKRSTGSAKGANHSGGATVSRRPDKSV